ncbi:hypothetical protein DMA15_03635 [Streptomyces sp. WAC 01529]|uniref:hypothetical protein n=1 Tax=Streptomyces sp. WAC 01529 TaxID=2203205 RepID=UPI000F71E52E|nr:hypothetical protein [Streptomyces sp. WAC 01529]AZM51785.1 hypothetical protein DMA15_03635 [Streptomyces sp. WAC 01529]
MTQTIKHAAADKVMTLDEIEAFCRQVRAAGAAGTGSPKVRITFGGQLRSMEITVDGEAPKGGVQ